MEEKVILGGEWLRKLAERVGHSEREAGGAPLGGPGPGLPSWAVREQNSMSGTAYSKSEIDSLADVPGWVKRRLQEEAVQQAFHRLETPLRFLLYATVPGQEPQSVQECHGILNLWRQGLEQEVRLVPDAYCGAVIPYQPTIEEAYRVHGRCEPGDPLRITIPAWRIEGKIVVRGEAELLHCDETQEGAELLQLDPTGSERELAPQH